MPAAAVPDAMAMTTSASQPMIDHFDHGLAFDDALLDGGALAPLSFNPAYDFENFTTTFEDPFSYTARAFEPTPNADTLNEESSPQELDNKLLGFSETIRSLSVVDETGNVSDTPMSAELYGMFFVAEDVFGGENAGRPLELTCYRRNLWQCSGQITLPRTVTHAVDDQGLQFPISELSASISALESIEGKATEIISIPWKNANLQGGDENGNSSAMPSTGGTTTANSGGGSGSSHHNSHKLATAPPLITLDLATAQELDANLVSLPVSWKRLQFKHATANNGRRKGLQQHYVVQINLLGKNEAGETIKIAEVQSGPVIVRGRSPRNFDSRRDVILTGDKRPERKNTASSDATIKLERDSLQPPLHKYQAVGNVSTPTEWTTPQPATAPTTAAQNQLSHPAKRVAMSPNVTRPPVPAWSADATSNSKAIASSGGQPARASFGRTSGSGVPISLSLSEDEKSSTRSSAEIQSPQLGKSLSMAAQYAGNSPAEDPDPLYEYFPLTVDDWMPPVDAVYRPHVVHHTIVPPEIKAQQVRSKAKRYFAAE
ncbi:hypothetical protein CDD81_492 [Ophiocordyceps australis]|uniref:NDT80 domain-containing protein n=1 Tax=Ophiocordyceps australis TaxID=1399860 RepID=A0A2C5Y0X8_9HYPO|nr:hypothetical protein CDD81_492 [Ophiocordyceps australis]